MTTVYYQRTIPLNNNGAQIILTRNTNGADTSPELRSKGILLDNPYTAVWDHYINEPAVLDIFGGYEASVLYASGGYKSWVDPLVPSNIKAMANLLDKYKRSDFNLAVSVGESRESWHMIADRMFSFASALRRTRRGDLRGALRALGSTKRPSRRAQRKLDSGDISGSFLELQYGWVPLLNDIYNAAELITSPSVSKPTLRSSVHQKGPDRETVFPGHQKNSTTFENSRNVYHIAKLSNREVSWAVRLGLAQPLSIAWELTTLSFVVDWFAPIGDVIKAYEATYIIPVGTYIKSDVLRQHCRLHLPAGSRLYGPWDTTVRNTCNLAYKRTEMTRTVSSTMPDAVYDGGGPRQSLIDFDLSLRQVASAGALLHQAFQAFRR